MCDGERRALALTEKEEEISLVPMASFQQRGPALGTHISASHGWGQLDSTCVRSCVRVKILDRDSNEANAPTGGESPQGRLTLFLYHLSLMHNLWIILRGVER